MAREIQKAKLPTVSVFPSDDIPPIHDKMRYFAEVHLDSRSIGVKAAQHLLECCFFHFGVVGEVYDASWSRERVEAFIETIVPQGRSVVVYPTPSEQDWSLEQKGLSKWLKSLPKPIGIFAATDIRARNVIETCKHAGIQVPEEVAVVGVDNDELFCEMTSPKLSSVDFAAERAGYESAKILSYLMSGKKAPPAPYLGALRVVVRRSSDVLGVDDLLIREAVHYIRDCYAQPINVSSVVRAMAVSRRQLEIRFKKVLGHSILEEIKKRRLRQVCALLAATDLTLDQITELSGFQSKNYLVNVFRKEFGTTMMMFRKSHQK